MEQMMIFLFILIAIIASMWTMDQRYQSQMLLEDTLRGQKEESVEDTLNHIRMLQYNSPHKKSLERYRDTGRLESERNCEEIISKLDGMGDLVEESDKRIQIQDNQCQRITRVVKSQEHLNKAIGKIEWQIGDSANKQVLHNAQLADRSNNLGTEIRQLTEDANQISRQIESIREVI